VYASGYVSVQPFGRLRRCDPRRLDRHFAGASGAGSDEGRTFVGKQAWCRARFLPANIETLVPDPGYPGPGRLRLVGAKHGDPQAIAALESVEEPWSETEKLKEITR